MHSFGEKRKRGITPEQQFRGSLLNIFTKIYHTPIQFIYFSPQTSQNKVSTQ
jgi:hypothetical protein